MASEVTRDPLRGLLIPDERATIWAAESSYTEAGPRAPGACDPSGVSQMALVAQGDQSSGTSYEVRALRAGVARSAPHLAAAYAWRSGSSGDWWGWDAPSVLTRIEVPVPVNTGTPTAILYARNPDMLALPDGTCLIAYEVRDTGSGSPYQVRVSKRATDGTYAAAVGVHTSSVAPPTDQAFYPALVRLPSGRILAYQWVFDFNGLEANIRVHYSDDDGTTWAVGQQYALDQPISYASLASGSGGSPSYVTGPIRAAYALGQVLVVASITSLNTSLSYRSVILQAASSDYGMTLERVEIGDGSDVGPAGAAVIGTASGVILAYAAGADASGADAAAPIRIKRLGSAYTPISSESAISPAVLSSNISAGVNATATKITSTSGIALTAIGDTIMLHYVVDHPSLADHFGAALYTTDTGRTWHGLYASASSTSTGAAWIDVGNRSVSGGTADKRPMRLSSAHVNGTILIASEYDGDSATEQSLFVHFLGGYSTVTMPGFARWLDPRKRATWSHTWVPCDTPNNVGWTATGAGTSTLDGGYLALSTTANTRYYSIVPTSSIAQGYLVLLSGQIVSGGSVATGVISAVLQLDDATDRYTAQINFSTTGFRVTDVVAGTTLVTVTVDTTGGIDILVGMANNDIAVWYRQRLASTATQRSWTLAVATTLTRAAPGTGNSIVWGHRTTGTASSRWYAACYTVGTETGYQLAEGQTNPDDLHPCPFSAVAGTTIASTIRLFAESGSAVRGDTWTIEPEHDYALARCLPATGLLSPRWAWRSTSTAVQTIALQLSEVGDTSLGSDLIGIAGFGCNIPRILIHGYDVDTTTWVLLATVDLHEGLSGLRWTREGTAVRPTGSGNSTNEPYLYHEEAAGWTFALSDTVARRITHSAEGKWTDETQRKPVLMGEFESVDPTSGTSGYLIPSDWCVVLDLQGVVYSALRITIPAPTTGIPAPAETYWQIGTLIVGPVVVHGEEYGWGRTLDVVQGAEVTEARDGTRIAASIRPARRIVEYGWPDPTDMTAALDPDGDPDPDYLEASANSGSLPVASARGTPYHVEGVIRRLGGGASPVVYLPRIPKIALNEAVEVLNRRHELMLGRVTSDVAIENVLGNELENEAVRVAVLRIEEET